MDYKTIRDLSFREVALPNLVLPVTSVQPSLTIVAASFSFMMAFGLTWVFQDHLVRSVPPCPISPASLGILNTI